MRVLTVNIVAVRPVKDHPRHRRFPGYRALTMPSGTRLQVPAFPAPTRNFARSPA